LSSGETKKRALVCGGRRWGWTRPQRRAIERVLDGVLAMYGHVVIVHGDSKGVDTIARQWAESRGVEHEPHPAEWGKCGLGAGPIRNEEMVRSGISICIAFPGGKGTAEMVRRAQRTAGVAVVDLRDQARAARAARRGGRGGEGVTKPVCVVCQKRPAAVPDRNKPGSRRREVCRECHANRLMGDLQSIVRQRKEPKPRTKPLPREGVCCSCGYADAEEIDCPAREGRTHCAHWWDGPPESDGDER